MKKLFIVLASFVLLFAGCLTPPPAGEQFSTPLPSMPSTSIPAFPTITLPDIYASPSPEPSVEYQPPEGCITMQPTEILYDEQGRHPPEAFGIFGDFSIIVRPDGFYKYVWDNATERESIYAPRVCFLNATGLETVGLSIINRIGEDVNVTFQEYEYGQAEMHEGATLGIQPSVSHIEVTSLADGSTIAELDILDFPAWPENKHGPGYR